MRTLVFMALLGAVAPLTAQESEKFFCFRPGPISSCRSYALFALRAQVPLVQGQRSVEVLGRLVGPDGAIEETRDVFEREELAGTVSWDLGYAVNVNETWAVGATWAVDFSGDGERQEGSLQFRRRLTDDISIDLAPGILRLRDPRDEFITGFHVATRLHFWDAVLGLRYDALDVKGRVDVRDRIGGGGTYTTTDPGGLEHSLSAAIAFESLSGLALSVAIFVLASLVPIS